MKRLLACLLIFCVLASCSGCGLLVLAELLDDDMGFGSKQITDPLEYGDWESYLQIPPWMPASVEEYTVNGYSYSLEAYMDVCYEILVDLTVTEEQLEELLARARQYGPVREQDAYYAEGYREMVFQDVYEIYPESLQSGHRYRGQVGWADVEKIVYNPQALNVVFVCFHANDTGVYELKNVAYFNRFGIDQEEYVAHTDPSKGSF